MTANPIGKDTKTIGINMSKKMSDEIERRAKSMRISTSAYCKILLTQWIESGQKMKLEEK